MRVLIKIVQDDTPNAPGDWLEIMLIKPFPPGNSWVAAAEHLAPYAPKGYNIVAYEIASP